MGVGSALKRMFTRDAQITSAEDLLTRARERRSGRVHVTQDTALRNAAVWACLRLRADLVSAFPIDVYRYVQGIQVEVAKPPVLVSPGGLEVGIKEWMYSTQFDLDRAGNCFGIITERTGVIGPDGRGLPGRIELVELSTVSVRGSGPTITKFVIGGKEYEPWEVWHEKQYTVAGAPLGLSPVAYAAWTIEETLSAQQFARDWFAAGAVPLAELKNNQKTVDKAGAQVAREQFRAAVDESGLFVHGNDWEYKPIQAVASQSAFLEARQYGAGDIARFFGVPGDLIDVAVSGSSVTYASMTQRNLQFLIMNLGPAVGRREDAFSRKLVSGPRFVKLNTDALLRMDPEARARTIGARITNRTLAPSEARALDNLPPFTEDQLAEFDRLFGARSVPAQPTTAVPGAPS
ncbi:phage portal protein [Streptomyces acidiscabies]|uniref:Phage portal protein n=1 Tax=Streptomyces acidiscabies TaxID=42234 RepID=A0AAP6BLZ3_9ACTN|nr:phage portal protein [Streptomyces acidiscabies]MBZ3918193.1 phage portal protein [Streptomyces acidiscabies]MDX2967125.1 phage portal protein [Streptomyces acidiscabies]MDX3016740.1 phage portal protein [Streptomyces acidiscabies]MDX3788352.1 phage portal protein [Streptomyces acidiscabies]